MSLLLLSLWDGHSLVESGISIFVFFRAIGARLWSMDIMQ